MSIFNPEPVTLPESLVRECMNYLNGKLVSSELMEQIKNLKNQDPTLSKSEIVEILMDYHERLLRQKSS